MANTEPRKDQGGSSLILHSKAAGLFYVFVTALELLSIIVKVLNAVPIFMLLSFPTMLHLAAGVLLIIGFYGKKDMLIIIGYAGLLVKYLLSSLWLAKLLYVPAWLLALGISVVCLTDQMKNMKKGLSRVWVLPAVLYALGALLEQFMQPFTYGDWDSDKMAADRAVEQHQKDAQKRIITNSAIGNAVVGLAGGITAAVSTANRVNAEGAQLQAEQARANQRYQDALEKSVRK